MKYRRTVNIDFDTRCKKLETALKRFYAKYPELEKDSREQYEYMYENGIEHEDNASPTDRDAWTWRVWLCHDDGYFYFAWIEREPEETEPAEPDETETETETANENEEEKTMANYDYMNAMTDDIRDYIAEEINRDEWTDDREGLEEKLNDDLWTADSVTGNASGSYFCNAYRAKEAFLNDPKSEEYFSECCADFGITAEEVGKHFIHGDYEWFDVTIRCYLLGQAISEVLDELEESGYFDEIETDTDDIDELTAAEIETA